MAILTNTGRSELVRSIFEQPIFMGWGKADGAWQEPQPESTDATNLQDPIGYRKATQVSYCEPDQDGEISVSSGSFSKSVSQTRHLYIQFKYDFDDAKAQTIREIGVFLNTQTQADLPDGQMYFDHSQVTDPGQMLLLENYRALFRDDGVRESFDFVVTF
jgi:hypothetical protein